MRDNAKLAEDQTCRAYSDTPGDYDYINDRNPNTFEKRNLDFRASVLVTIPEAVGILCKALACDEKSEAYNHFVPKVLRKLPKGSMIRLARESSVCVYVETLGLLPNSLKKTMKADEFDLKDTANGVNTYRIWWD